LFYSNTPILPLLYRQPHARHCVRLVGSDVRVRMRLCVSVGRETERELYEETMSMCGFASTSARTPAIPARARAHTADRPISRATCREERVGVRTAHAVVRCSGFSAAPCGLSRPKLRQQRPRLQMCKSFQMYSVLRCRMDARDGAGTAPKHGRVCMKCGAMPKFAVA